MILAEICIGNACLTLFQTMKKNMLRRLLMVAVALLLSLPWDAAARSWDIVRLDAVPEAKVVVRQTDVEIRAARGVIYIVTNRPVKVEVYSILGHLVAKSSLQNGSYRMSFNNHGVYLVKIGDLTCKVAI